MELDDWYDISMNPGDLATVISLSQSVAVKGSMLTVCARGGSRCSVIETYYQS